MKLLMKSHHDGGDLRKKKLVLYRKMNIHKRKGLIPKGRNKRKPLLDSNDSSARNVVSNDSIGSTDSKVRSDDVEVRSQNEKKS